MTTGERRRLYE